MDSIRVSEAPDSGSIPDEATKRRVFLRFFILRRIPGLDVLPIAIGRIVYSRKRRDEAPDSGSIPDEATETDFKEKSLWSPLFFALKRCIGLQSAYDNDLRKQKSMAGAKEKLMMGIWCTKAPVGYGKAVQMGRFNQGGQMDIF